MVGGKELKVAAAAVIGLLLLRTLRSHRSMMADEKKQRDGQPTKNTRQDRLKLALRENLKRRKSQARGRSDVAATPRDDAGGSLHDELGEEPGE